MPPGPYTVDGVAPGTRHRHAEGAGPARPDAGSRLHCPRDRLRSGYGHGDSPPDRDEEQRDRDQRHRGADQVAAAGQPQLPELRGALAGSAHLRRRDAQGGQRGRGRGLQHQRLHRRHPATRTTSSSGGVAGQDSSRGNPFPQNAVQEFRVLTQNFKAEYEKATTSIITAVTKSGTNDYPRRRLRVLPGQAPRRRKPLRGQEQHGQAGVRTRSRSASPSAGRSSRTRSTSSRPGSTTTRPRQNRRRRTGGRIAAPALRAPSSSRGPASSTARSRRTSSSESSPGRPAPTGLLDVTGSTATKSEIRDFGNGQDSFQSATDAHEHGLERPGQVHDVASELPLRDDARLPDYKWNPHPPNPDLSVRNYENAASHRRPGDDAELQPEALRHPGGLLSPEHPRGRRPRRQGGRRPELQQVRRPEVPGGEIRVFQLPAGPRLRLPFQARYGVGNPDLSTTNNQYGIYLQDDWTVNSRLTVNAGIRWDYETDMLNNDYVTPPQVRADLGGSGARPLLHGRQRPARLQERLPAAPRVSPMTSRARARPSSSRGYGRYVDRDVYNHDSRREVPAPVGDTALPVLRRRLSRGTASRRSSGTPSYLSAARLGRADLERRRPQPRSLPDRQRHGAAAHRPVQRGHPPGPRPVGVSLSYAAMRGKNGFTWIFGNRGAGRHVAACSFGSFSNVLLSDATKRFWYDAFFLSSGQAVHGVVPLGRHARLHVRRGRRRPATTRFTLDCLASECLRVETPAPPDRQRRAATGSSSRGSSACPGTSASRRSSPSASGLPYTIFDASQGFGPNEFELRLNEGEQDGTFPYQSWDFRLQKEFLIADVVSVGRQRRSLQRHEPRQLRLLRRLHPPATIPRGPTRSSASPTALTTPARHSRSA